MTDNCIVCELPNQQSGNAGLPDVVRYMCVRCGQFDITGSAIASIGLIDMRHRPMISDWVRETNFAGQTPLIKSDTFSAILSRRRITWREKADRLLLSLLSATDRPGVQLHVTEPQFAGTLQSYDPNVAIFLARLLLDEGWVTGNSGNPQLVTVAPKGFIHADELKAKATASSQAFVAMSFSDDLRAAWLEGFEPGILHAGYTPLRIDRKEHVGKIDDEIIAEIRQSRFIIADFTGHRAGVYFEAGFASGLGLPVIWSCRKSDMSGLHFDIRQYNCIDWQKPAELADRLHKRILALLGSGPHRQVQAG